MVTMKEEKMNKLFAKTPPTVLIAGHNQYRTVIFGLIIGILNLSLGFLILILEKFISVSIGIWPLLFLIFFGGLFVFSSWLAWLGNVRVSFFLILTNLFIQFLIFELTFSGFGAVWGVIFFVLVSVLVIETMVGTAGNIYIYLSFFVGLLLFLIDDLGAEGRIVLSNPLISLSPYLTISSVIFLFFVYLKNFNSMNYESKISIPIVIISGMTVIVVSIYLSESINKYFAQLVQQGNPNSIDKLTILFSQQIAVLEKNFRLVNVASICISTTLLIILTRLILSPLRKLTEYSRKVQSGNLNIHLNIDNQDEIREIVDVFNLVVFRLRQILETLDLRVSERTRDLAGQNEKLKLTIMNLQAILEISNDIAQVKEYDELFQSVVDSISRHLSFSQVSFFLVDSQNEYAILRAVSGEVGKRIATYGKRIKIDPESDISRILQNGKASISTLPNETFEGNSLSSFPETGSKLCLPLGLDACIFGFLDIQSKKINDFSPDDFVFYSFLVKLISSYFAILTRHNEISNLFGELQVFREEKTLKDWARYIDEKYGKGYNYAYGDLTTITSSNKINENFDWVKLRDEGVVIESPPNLLDPKSDTIPSIKLKEMDKGSSLIVPISLRGQLIGTIKLQEEDPSRKWSLEEISFMQEVADQVGLALENARLFEDTQQRAEREATVSRIAVRLRASSDPDEIIQTAIHELQKSLNVKVAQIKFSEESYGLNNESPEKPVDDFIDHKQNGGT